MGVDDGDVALMLKIIKDGDKDRSLVNCMMCPSRPRVEEEFLTAFPNHARLARPFSLIVTDDYGSGRVSLRQLRKHFGQHASDAEAAVRTAHESLVDVPMKKPPEPTPAPPPTDWVVGWLEAEDLGEHAKSFLDANLKTRADVAAEPFLTARELKDLGIDTLGDCRKIVRMIKALRAPE